MKKTFTLCALILSNFVCFAQWSMHLYSPGDNMYSHNISNYSNFYSNTLNNGPWDFSTANVSAMTQTINYINPAGTTLGNNFPQATVAFTYNNDSTYINYCNIANNHLVLLGSTFFNMVTTYQNPRIFWNFSLSQSTLVHDSCFGVTTTNGNQIATQFGNNSIIAMSVSDILLPNGINYSNVLKIKLCDTNYIVNQNSSQDMYIYDNFYYLHPNFKFPILKYTRYSDNGGVSFTHSAELMEPSLISGIVDHSENYNFKILGNICSDNLDFILNLPNKTNSSLVNIISLNGQIVDTKELNLMVGQNTQSLNTSTIAKGVYLLNIVLDDKQLNAYFIKD